MSAIKKILKRYFANFYSREANAFFVFWLIHKRSDPEIETTLEEIWNGIDVPENAMARNELRVVKEKLGFTQPTVQPLRRFGRWAIYLSAACACALIVSMLLHLRPGMADPDRNEILAQFDSFDIGSVRETTLMAGETIITVGDDKVITQTENGNLIIDEGEPMEILSEFVQVVVPAGKHSRVRLGDGSEVWLNSRTKLLFPQKLGNRSRDIHLDGEIYLDVAENPARPFIVNTGNMNVRVLGTQFNIRSYSAESGHSVVLVEGEVEVETADKKSKETLRPGQGIFYDNDTTVKREVDVDNYIYWKNRVLKLDGESLEGIFEKLSEFYNVIIDHDGTGDGRQYRGKLLLEESVEDVLSIIAVKEGFTFARDGATITIQNR